MRKKSLRSITNKKAPALDRAAFLANYEGMEELIAESVQSFFENIPSLLLAVETAITNKKPGDLEIAAHTIKGALSNFYAGPSRESALCLEEMGRNQVLEGSERIFAELSKEIERLSVELRKLLLKQAKAA